MRSSWTRRLESGPVREASDGVRRTGPALEAMYQLTRWLIPTLDRFPRRQKFLLGDRIQTTALTGLERLVEATLTRNRGRLLDRVNVDLDKLRLLMRLSKELGCLNTRCYEHAATHRDRGGRGAGRRPSWAGSADGRRHFPPMRVRRYPEPFGAWPADHASFVAGFALSRDDGHGPRARSRILLMFPRKQRPRTQSSVLATRKPAILNRFPAGNQLRSAERRNLGLLPHEPPRNTRRPQSPPLVHALPSLGAPA